MLWVVGHVIKCFVLIKNNLVYLFIDILKEIRITFHVLINCMMHEIFTITETQGTTRRVAEMVA